MIMKVLVTGASGFVGQGVTAALLGAAGLDVSVVTRRGLDLDGNVTRHVIGDMSPETEWSEIVSGKDLVVHLAGLAHVRSRAADGRSDFDRVNHRTTERLAAESAQAGVRRFVFLSSVAVHGRLSTHGDRLTSSSPLRPATRYAESKARGEDAVRAVGQRSGMEVVVIRPPLVYGPNAPGNYGRLVRLVRSRLPLPLGGLDNRRSLIGRGNLADLVVRCATHPGAAGRAFLASDDDDVSTPRLLRCIANAMGFRPFLYPAPRPVVSRAIRLFAGAGVEEQLLDSFLMDISETKAMLDWRPPHSVDQGIAASLYEARR
jgi:nucleoside-diphosphate-sugar epimerase